MIGAKAILRRKTKDSWTHKHRHVMRKLVVEGGRVQKRMYDVGMSDEEVSRLRHGRRHGETQAVPLSVLKGSRKLDPRGIGEMRTQSWNVEGTLEMTKRCHVVSFERKPLEEEPPVSPMGVGSAQELEHSSRRLPEPCCSRRFFVGSFRQVGRECVVSGATGS